MLEMFFNFLLNPLKSYTKNSGTKEFSNDGTFDLSKATSVGNIQMMKPNMEVNFEIRIYNWDSYPTEGFIYLLFIQPWLVWIPRKICGETRVKRVKSISG